MTCESRTMAFISVCVCVCMFRVPLTALSSVTMIIHHHVEVMYIYTQLCWVEFRLIHHSIWHIYISLKSGSGSGCVAMKSQFWIKIKWKEMDETRIIIAIIKNNNNTNNCPALGRKCARHIHGNRSQHTHTLTYLYLYIQYWTHIQIMYTLWLLLFI